MSLTIFEIWEKFATKSLSYTKYRNKYKKPTTLTNELRTT